MKGLLGIWLVICVCACTSKDVCHVQGRIKGIKDDVENCGSTSGCRVSV